MCKFEGCDREVKCKGLCQAHYMQTRLGIELKPLRKKHATAEEKKAALAANSLAHYHRAMQRIQAIKIERGCIDCGYNAHPEALDFDHIEDNKIMGVSKMAGRKWETIEAEIAKCEVVCANCHRVRTSSRRTSLTVQ